MKELRNEDSCSAKIEYNVKEEKKIFQKRNNIIQQKFWLLR